MTTNKNNNIDKDDKSIATNLQEAKERTQAIANETIEEAKAIINEVAEQETIWQFQTANGKKAKDAIDDIMTKACADMKVKLAKNQTSDTAMSIEQLTQELVELGVTYHAKVNALACLCASNQEANGSLTQLEHDLIGTGENIKVVNGQLSASEKGATMFYKYLLPQAKETKKKVNTSLKLR